MTDRTNVITVTQENLDWINANVPGSSKQKRLEELLRFYKERNAIPVVKLSQSEYTKLQVWAKQDDISVAEALHRILDTVRIAKEGAGTAPASIEVD
ncbi:hypothetical protein [Methanoregula sp.]|uniref:hypothetical protein n=1 Tax=Methanoregula sp. TaxID=2052170 RepID=UPI000CBB2304|nr:hypothetical protein [Methanoregula sp.]PKG31582.1 MAG: hypothetical protein CW742_12660 [Methanoregula sp.]